MSDTYDSMSGTSLLNELRGMFPWIDQIGLSPEFFQRLIADSASGEEMLVRIRQEPAYKSRFVGMWRPDGSLRMNEAQYLAREQDYMTVLRQYGFAGDYGSPASLVGIFDAEMDPNELRDRVATYRALQENSREVKDAFFVYAGLRVSDEDLYQAVVDPAAAQRLQDEYNAQVAKSTLDYSAWIRRATELGLERVAGTLTELQRSGALTGQAVQTVLRVDPNFAVSIMDALYTNAGTPGSTMNLADLMASFEYAAIGAAARQSGLELPTRERVAAIRAAGVDRTRASQAYQSYGMQASRLDDAVRRATGGRFGQQDFENATFLGDAAAQGALASGLAREEAAGQSVGVFQQRMSESGRIVQTGMRTP